MIIYTILFGMSTFKWNYSEYVTMLSVMGFLTGATLFCWIVVFTFRKNLLMVAKYSLAPTAQSTGSFKYCQALSISLSIYLNLSLSLRDRDRADTIITFHPPPTEN